MALDLPRQNLIEALATGQIELTGEFSWGSNRIFLVDVIADSTRLQGVYKPAAGERPLWDFPRHTLARREVAAYHASRALGWDLVPPTVLREDGPAGGGSLQLYLDLDPERHYFSLDAEQRRRLAPVAVFDVLINNADRKAGHVLLDDQDHLWLIDHGVCFHEEYKLRTVIWDFAEQPIPVPLLHDVERFSKALAAVSNTSGAAAAQRAPEPAVQPGSTDAAFDDYSALATLLAAGELSALELRARQLLETKCYPAPGPERSYPWPLI